MVYIATCVLAMQSLTGLSFGIFLISLTREFDWERGSLSIALSINMLVSGPLTILTGKLSDRYGPRLLVTANGILMGIALLLMSQISALWQVYLIWGVLMGVAGSCAGIPIISTIPRWFTRKRGIALGIALAGFGWGGIIAAPLAQWLISSYDWRRAYIVLGILCFIIITSLAQFLKHSPQRIGLRPYGENSPQISEQTLPVGSGGFSLKQATKIAAYAVDIKIPAVVAASILSIIAVGNTAGRLFLGFMADWIGAKRALVACLVMTALALAWLLISREVWMFYIFAVLFGLAWGGLGPSVNLINAELFGLKSLGMILAGLTLFGTIGGSLGAPLAGYIFDVTRSYSTAFIIGVVLSALATILSLLILRHKGKSEYGNN